ncbi:hypothetical protein [Ahrensia kielensis]|uniref:hypothetical protein n=1 Tax=Ahrensia kielensis TaxID=76980 RepID=UPI00037A948C|nr:hypothetical protein [Ahrensia kielensis]
MVSKPSELTFSGPISQDSITLQMSNSKKLKIPSQFSKNTKYFCIIDSHFRPEGKSTGSKVQHKRPNVRPILYKRISAAAALDISPATFDLWVEQGLVPKGQKIGGLRMWRISELEAAVDDLIEGLSNKNEHLDHGAAFEDFEG